MHISHQGHSCVLIEKDEIQILLDPGTFAFDVNGKKPEDFTNIAAILLTHEHQDHTDPEILRRIIVTNPSCRVITNGSIKKILAEKNIESEIITFGQEITIGSLVIQGVDCPHGPLPVPVPESIGFLINGAVLHPSDSIEPRGLSVIPRVLLAPACAPWMTANDAIAFVEKIKPEIVMPIHDAVYRYPYMIERLFVNVLRERGYRVEQQSITL